MADHDVTTRYRSVFLSDIHLGTRGCQAELLLDFLRHTQCDQLYLVGDIVDGWKLKSRWYWPQPHNDVVQKILRLARKGVAVTYIPGNHDETARDFCGAHFGGVFVTREAVHQSVDGRRFLVVHGDEFDTVVRHAAWLAHAGDFAYRGAVWLNTLLNIARRRLGFGYWSLSAFLKSRVKNALKFIDNYEVALAGEARRRGLDGVICGHIHKAEMRDVEGILYVNDGDWVESCTALVEHVDGRLEILRWADHRSWSMIDHAARPTAVAANAAAEKSDTSGPRASPLAERRPGASLRSAVALARKLCADGVNTARNARLRAGTLAVRMWRLRIRFVVFGR